MKVKDQEKIRVAFDHELEEGYKSDEETRAEIAKGRMPYHYAQIGHMLQGQGNGVHCVCYDWDVNELGMADGLAELEEHKCTSCPTHYNTIDGKNFYYCEKHWREVNKSLNLLAKCEENYFYHDIPIADVNDEDASLHYNNIQRQRRQAGWSIEKPEEENSRQGFHH